MSTPPSCLQMISTPPNDGTANFERSDVECGAGQTIALKKEREAQDSQA
jgi:hypothetical protein